MHVRKIFKTTTIVFTVLLCNPSHNFITNVHCSSLDEVLEEINLDLEPRSSSETILPISSEQLKTVETGDIILMTGTNSFSFALRSPYTHVGMILKDSADRLFVFESSWGFSGIPPSYEMCNLSDRDEQNMLDVTTRDGVRIIALQDIKRYYEEQQQKITYHVFKQTEGINKNRLHSEIARMISCGHQYPKSFFSLLTCVIPFWPKTKAPGLFCSEAIASLLINADAAIRKVKSPYRYKPAEIIESGHFPYERSPIKLFEQNK
jgi:hypothetical protein